MQVEVVSGAYDPTTLEIGAWTVEYAWDVDAASFSSSSPTLDAVYQQASYTLKAGVLDTFTDSNTRERRPYEADELVAASSRFWVQADVALSRHSTSYVLEYVLRRRNRASTPRFADADGPTRRYPTWPIEWMQMSNQLAWLDYWATGETVVAEASKELLRNNSKYPADADGDALGLLNCSKPPNFCECKPSGDGHHIVDW